MLSNCRCRDLPHDSAVKTPYFQSRGRRFAPWSGSKDHTCHLAKKKRKEYASIFIVTVFQKPNKLPNPSQKSCPALASGPPSQTSPGRRPMGTPSTHELISGFASGDPELKWRGGWIPATERSGKLRPRARASCLPHTSLCIRFLQTERVTCNKFVITSRTCPYSSRMVFIGNRDESLAWNSAALSHRNTSGHSRQQA